MINGLLLILVLLSAFWVGTKWKSKRPSERRSGYNEKYHGANVVVICEFILILMLSLLFIAASWL